MNYQQLRDPVLKVAKSKRGVILYKDFYHLHPKARSNHWLLIVKRILLDNNYVCHERRHRAEWRCNYNGAYTHFHKPGK